MKSDNVIVYMLLYLTSFTLLGNLFGLTTFPPETAKFSLMDIPQLGSISVSISLTDPLFLIFVIIGSAVVGIAVNAIPMVDMDASFVTGATVGLALTGSLGYMLTAAMGGLPFVLKFFLVWIPVLAVILSVFRLIVRGGG
ncbi:MAG: hypothetical protein ACLFVX_10020 [Archaeoglobaceae archaeon]